MSKPFKDRIYAMNQMYKLPINSTPTLLVDPADKLKKFKTTLMAEVHEIDEIVEKIENGETEIDVKVAIADLQ